ncbi:MAG TPA: carboxypeptidase regulatory-like domain-containing protein [Pyrinomonadaceae bacterium]|jgi:hypothetical protein
MNHTDFYTPFFPFHRETVGRALPETLSTGRTANLSARKRARRATLARWLLVSLLVAIVFPLLAVAQTRPPVLISEPTSTRAIAFESPTFFREPFSLTSPYAWNTDRRTRVMLFALNLSLQPGEDLAVVTAEAEDAVRRRYNLQVEYVGPVPSQSWLSAVVLRLSDDLTNAGDVLVRVYYRGVGSNRVRIGVGHIGGGPPDDAGAGPTIVPPYVISGRVVDGANSFSGVHVTLSGTQTQTKTTDDNGFYSFTVESIDDYVLTASKPYYDFSPTSRSFINLSNHQQNVNFNAARQAFNINGQVLDEHAQPLSGIEVALFNEVGGQMSAVLTDAGGQFLFTNILAGYNYSAAATSNNFFTFTRQNINALAGHQTLSFSGVRSVYTIQGKALNATGEGLGGVTVNLSGSQTATTTTDAQGNYSFADLPAAGTYDVAASRVFYVLSPQHQTFNNLGANQQANFAAVDDNRIISGRVTDSNGDGLRGVTINLSGSQTRAVKTDNDGRFSLPAGATGDYTITPFIEQDSYLFTPSNLSLQNLNGNHTVSFTAARTPHPNPTYVLEFDGAQKTVDYGPFWTPYVDLGHFYWEFWAMPGTNAGSTYMLSDGYGGAHALLFGFSHYNVSEPGRYQLFGNIFDGYVSGPNIIFFSSDEGPAAGEWGHFAVGWDGQSIITYFNGVPVGKSAYAGTRATPSPGHGGTRLLIGGSDHNNLVGRIAQVRGYEGRNPLEDANGPTGGTVEAAFVPQTIFSGGANLVSYFFRPAPTIADFSRGFDGIAGNGSNHPGLLRGTGNGVLYDCAECPPPRFVIDQTAPDFVRNIAPQPVLVPTPPTVPNQARIFDSFSRANSTYLFYGQGGLGATEGGTEGQQTWQTAQSPAALQSFGILNGRAVLLANEPSVAWVANAANDGNLDVRVERRAGFWGSGLDTGLSFRVVNHNNLFFAYTSESNQPSAPRKLAVGYYLDGERTDLTTNVLMPLYWTKLRVVAKNDGSIKVYADTTLVYSTNSKILLAGKGAGLYNNSSGSGLSNRWDNFTVYDAP